jgi:hypothetical protein
MSDEQKSYWLQVFNETTWREFLEAGGKVTGFRGARWGHVQKMKVGDILLCYLSRHSKWVGLLQLVSESYLDDSPIWKEDVFPCRADVKLIASLDLDDAISIHRFRDELTIFRVPQWSMYVMASPSKWKFDDGKTVEAAILAAAKEKHLPNS